LAVARDQKGNNDIPRADQARGAGDDHPANLLDLPDRDIVPSTNTFSANVIKPGDYAAERLVKEIKLASGADRLAALADEYAAKDGPPAFVAGAIGRQQDLVPLSAGTSTIPAFPRDRNFD